MMKKLTTIFALVALCATASMATDTRVLTLGDNHEVLVDDANVFLFPSRVSQFPNIAVAEIGQYYYYNDRQAKSDGGYYSDISRLGVNWKFGKAEHPCVLGTYFFTNLQDPLNGAMGATSVADLAGFDYIYNLPNKRLEIVYGHKFSGVNFGFLFQYTAAGYSDKNFTDSTGGGPYTPFNEYKESASQMCFGVGLSDKAYTWDVAAKVQLTSFNQKAGGVTRFENDGGMDVWVSGRLFHTVNAQWTIVPNVGIGFGTLGLKVKDSLNRFGQLLVAEKWSSFSGMAGVGVHYMPSNNVLAVIHPGIMFATAKHKIRDTDQEKYTNIAIPYFKMGVEGDVFPWLDARFGATSYWNNDKIEYPANTFAPNTPASERVYDQPYNATYLGFGFNFGRLHVDTYTDPALFLNGFNFISGQNTHMNFQLSALMELF